MAAANAEYSGSRQEELSQYFKTWDNSLFDLPEEQIKKLIIMDFEEKMWYTDALYSAAAILLRKENTSSAAQYITYTLEQNPTSIHAWCNQGVYCLSQRPPQLQQAEEAVEKMQELLREDKSKSDAVVEKAYWLHSKDRSAEAREKAMQMFEDQLFSETENFTHSHRYLYMKTLLGELKNTQERQQRKRYVQKLADQFTILAQSGDKTYELEMWSCLAEIQPFPSYSGLLRELDLTELKRVTGCDKPDLLYCTNKMLEIQANCPQVTIYSNFYYRVGNNFLYLSYKEDNKEERIEMLNKALRYSKEYLNTPASSFEKSPALCAKVLLWLWAIKYYEEHRDEVDMYVEERDKPKSVFPEECDEVKRWKYLAECYYSVTPDDSLTTRPYLEEARTHLENAMKPNRSYPSVQYPRILMLLGEKKIEVEKAFEKAKGEGSGILWQAHQGMFYEEVGNTQKALELYSAVDKNQLLNRWKLAGLLSTNGLSRLETTNRM